MTQFIPIISLAAIESSETRDKELEKLNKACSEIGFFYISDHELNWGLASHCFQSARKFFNMPIEYKEQFSHAHQSIYPKECRGFGKIGSEILNEKDGADKKEFFDLGIERETNVIPFEGLNVLPSDQDCPGFSYAMLELQEKIVRDVYPKILNAILDASSLKETLDRSIFYPPTLIQRVIRYPSKASTAGRHTDNGVCTLLIQETHPDTSLYAASNGNWLPVPPVEELIVVNIGDLFQLMTDGAVKSTPHYVEHKGKSDRISLPFFFYPFVESNFSSAQSSKPYSTRDIMLKNFQSIHINKKGAGRALELQGRAG